MLDINLLRNEPERVKKGIAVKNVDPKRVDDFLSLDEKWRKSLKDIEEKRGLQKKLSEARDIESAKKNKEVISEKENMPTIESKLEKALFDSDLIPYYNFGIYINLYIFIK